VFLALPMDVMEEMTSVGIAEVSTIDRAAVAGSLDRLADHLAAIAPGKLAIAAGRRSARIAACRLPHSRCTPTTPDCR
jgi:hypothetical protein